MRRLLPAGGPLILLSIWFLVSASGRVSSIVLPPPQEVLVSLVRLIQTAEFWVDLRWTAYRLVFGYGLAVVVFVPAGFLLGYYGPLYSMNKYLIDFLRAIPAVAFFPVFLVIFGLGEEPKIGITAVMSGLMVLFSTAESVRSCNKTRVSISRVFGATSYQLMRKVLFWEALPGVLTGLRLGLSFGIIALIVTEMFSGTEHGVGFRIIDSSYYVRTGKMFALILVVGLMSLSLNKVFDFVRRVCVPWAGERRSGPPVSGSPRRRRLGAVRAKKRMLWVVLVLPGVPVAWLAFCRNSEVFRLVLWLLIVVALEVGLLQFRALRWLRRGLRLRENKALLWSAIGMFIALLAVSVSFPLLFQRYTQTWRSHGKAKSNDGPAPCAGPRRSRASGRDGAGLAHPVPRDSIGAPGPGLVFPVALGTFTVLGLVLALVKIKETLMLSHVTGLDDALFRGAKLIRATKDEKTDPQEKKEAVVYIVCESLAMGNVTDRHAFERFKKDIESLTDDDVWAKEVRVLSLNSIMLHMFYQRYATIRGTDRDVHTLVTDAEDLKQALKAKGKQRWRVDDLQEVIHYRIFLRYNPVKKDGRALFYTPTANSPVCIAPLCFFEPEGQKTLDLFGYETIEPSIVDELYRLCDSLWNNRQRVWHGHRIAELLDEQKSA